jgi:small-conductance mechanosensitive channel
MKTTIGGIVALLLFVAAPLGFAQRGGIEQIDHRHDPLRDQMQNATADQRAAVAKCIEATDQLRAVAGRMPRIGSPWSRSRLTYTASDLNALSNLTGQFETALAHLAATHEEFSKSLTDPQRSRFKRQLRKLEQLQAKMNSTSAELDRDLARAKPGPTSPNIAWDANSIKRTTDKWRSEHRKIAREMGIFAE